MSEEEEKYQIQKTSTMPSKYGNYSDRSPEYTKLVNRIKQHANINSYLKIEGFIDRREADRVQKGIGPRLGEQYTVSRRNKTLYITKWEEKT